MLLEDVSASLVRDVMIIDIFFDWKCLLTNQWP